MQSVKNKLSRRTLLKGMAVLPVVSFAGIQTAQAELVSVDDPTAKALGYVEASVVDGKNCANCGLYVDAGGTAGACAIFPGKQVLAAAYCNSWVPKA